MNESPPPYEEFLAFANRLADKARLILQQAAAVEPRVEIKQDYSFVTQTDKAVELELRTIIEQTYPHHGILGEEYGNKDVNSEFVWVLDPLDGTAPFIAGIPVYGSLISLAWEGSPFIGVIEHPATNDRWTGVANKFSLFNETPTHVRPCKQLAAAFATCSNPDYMDIQDRQCFEQVKKNTQYMQYGGACFAYGALANGKTDLAIDAGLKVFDVFAPAAVITGAGGYITNWDDQPLSLDMRGDVLATGDKFLHSIAISILKESRI